MAIFLKAAYKEDVQQGSSASRISALS